MADELIEILTGEFTHVLYKTEKYMVSKFRTEEGTITVTGPSFDFENGEKYVLTGHYTEHYRYGLQFNMLTIEKYLSDQKDEIISYLKSGAFPGVGKKTAEKIYLHFGSDTLKVLKEDPSRIFEIDLSAKQYQALQDGFQKINDPENEIMFYLVSNGFNNLEAQKIFSRFKLATVEVSQDNPFRFYNEVYGMSFDKVRTFAMKNSFDDAQNKYREAFLIKLISDYTFNTGDIYIDSNELNRLVNYYGGMENLEEILERCKEKEYILQEDERFYLSSDYYDELYISDYIRSFSSDLTADEVLVEEGIRNAENTLKIAYDKKQRQAIHSFFQNRISIITGGPGTGKTTIIKTMSEIFRNIYPFLNLIITAPTGRAAKRISEICNVESKTIHSLLRWDKESNTFVFGADNPILYDAIIIDEFSMVDNSLFASLLKACSRIKKICIIGDHNQLPSIRPGNLLNDLIASELIPTTLLDLNYRQDKGNDIVSLADDIIKNDVDMDRYQKNVFFYPYEKGDFDLISLIQEDMKDGYSLDEIQVLSPMYKGEWGIDNLNLLLQNTFNPRDISKAERRVGDHVFREGDKILQLKNRPTDDVYNGDIGILEEIDMKEKYLMVNYAGVYVFYPFDDLSDLSLAYAMSVHKSQGSEYQIVYFIFNRNNIHMLNKKLIYTAISRARKKLVIIGDVTLFRQGLARSMRMRATTLKERLGR